MDAHMIFWIMVFASILIFEIIFSVAFIFFIKKFIQDKKKQRNAIINYLFMTVFIIIALVVCVVSSSS